MQATQDSNEPKTERQKYIENLEHKLQKAGKAQRFKQSEDGGIITDYLTQQINAIVKNIGGTKYINDHNSYIYDVGQMAMAQKLLTMLNNEASQDTEDMANRLKEAKTDDRPAES